MKNCEIATIDPALGGLGPPGSGSHKHLTVLASAAHAKTGQIQILTWPCTRMTCKFVKCSLFFDG